MKKIFVVSAVLLTLVMPGAASAATLTFDDISSSSFAEIPDGYGGLNWDTLYYFNPDLFYIDSGYQRGRVSGDYVAYNYLEGVGTVDGTTFDFNSAYLTAAWNDGLSITVTGLLGGTELYSQTVIVNTMAPTLFHFNYLGIDELIFESSGGVPNSDFATAGSGTHFAMDDMTINAAVPDGGSALAMLGLGMIGVGVICRKFSV